MPGSGPIHSGLSQSLSFARGSDFHFEVPRSSSEVCEFLEMILKIVRIVFVYSYSPGEILWFLAKGPA